MIGRGTQKYRPSAMMRVVAATRRRVGLGTWSESATWPCYRNTLDRSCLQGNFPGVSASGGKASASGQRLFGHSRLAPTPLGRRTTALQNQGDQLSLSLGHQLTVSPQHGQILPFSSNGGTEPGTSQEYVLAPRAPPSGARELPTSHTHTTFPKRWSGHLFSYNLDLPTDRLTVRASSPPKPFAPRSDHLETHTETVMMAALEKKLGSTFSRKSTLPSPSPLLIVISGPSGVGKDAVINRLREVHGDMHFVVTATTRPRRQGEVDGEDYIFMDKEDFEDLIERNELLEHALVYGDYKGIPKQQVRKALGKGTDVVLRLDVQGAATIRRLIPESLSIFLVAENERALVRRLLGRKTEPLDRALVRVETARQETKRIAEFDYVVENPSGKLEDTVRKISSIIEAEKLRMQQKAIRI